MGGIVEVGMLKGALALQRNDKYENTTFVSVGVIRFSLAVLFSCLFQKTGQIHHKAGDITNTSRALSGISCEFAAVQLREPVCVAPFDHFIRNGSGTAIVVRTCSQVLGQSTSLHEISGRSPVIDQAQGREPRDCCSVVKLCNPKQVIAQGQPARQRERFV